MEQIAIVIGGNHHNTLGVIRGLGRKGVNSSVILHSKDRNNYVLKSRYVVDFVIVDSVEEMYSSLLAMRVEGIKQVVICASDLAASMLDNYYNNLRNYFYLPGCDRQGRLNQLMNKNNMSQLALNCGLHVPESVILSKNDNTSRVVFPCIMKPLISISGEKSDIAICYNKESLQSNLKKCKSEKIQVQTFINKIEEYQLIGLSTDNVLVPGKSIIITQPLSTNTGFLKYVNLDGSEPLEECKEFIKKTGYKGLFSMEFIRDVNGTDYFMEINFRNDGNAICVTDAGVNLPFLWYQYCRTIDFTLNDDYRINEIYVIPEYSEVNLWYSGNISFHRMLKELHQANTFMEFDPNDPKPTNGRLDLIRLIVKTIIKKTIKKLVRIVHK